VKNKGQFTIVSLIVTFMVIVAFIGLYPILKAYIDDVSTSMDTYTATLLQLSPFFIILTILITIIFMSLPVTETGK